MLLVYIGQLYSLADFECSVVRSLKSHDEAEECCLACTVRAYHAYDAIGREHEVKVLEQHFLSESLCDMLCIEHLVAETWSVGDEYLKFLLTLFLLLVEHCVVRVKTCLALGLTCLRCHAYPFKLALQGFLAF